MGMEKISPLNKNTANFHLYSESLYYSISEFNVAFGKLFE